MSDAPDSAPRKPGKKSCRSKSNPFRVLAACCYWDVEWVSRYSVGLDTHISVRTGRMRAYLALQSERNLDYLKWLAEHGYIRDLRFPATGHAEFVVRSPSTWNWSEPPDGAETELDGRRA